MAFDPLEPVKRDAESIAASLVDWSVLEGELLDEVECQCSTTFASLTKFMGPPLNKLLSRVPCPTCGTRTRFRRVTSPRQRG